MIYFQITESKLRDLFSSKGIVTDVQLKYTKDGVFRRFCFIGYESDDQAQDALQYFDKSCIETNRICVEVCAPLGNELKPKSWSKYSKDSSAFQKARAAEAATDSQPEEKKEKKKKTSKKNKEEITELIEEHKDDPMFAEFMKVHAKGEQLWDNDADAGGTQDPKKVEKPNKSQKPKDLSEEEDLENEEEVTEKVANANQVSDMDYMKMLQKKPMDTKPLSGKNKNIDFFTIKIFNLPYKAKRQDVMKFFKPIKPKSVRIPVTGRGYCYVGFKDEKDFKKAMFKNKSFMNGKQIQMVDFTEDNKKTLKKKLGLDIEGDDSSGNPDRSSKWAKQEDALKNEEDISESGKIYFRNLTYSVTEDLLQKLFEKYGPIAEVSLPIDQNTRKIKGFGTVTFVMPEHAVMAFSELDGHIFHGRMLHLLPAKSEKQKDLDDDDDLNGLTFKEKKAKKLKKTASSAHNWNTLFLGQNAVAELLARNYGTSKEHVLDTSTGGSSAAVRLALGETQVVMEMKKFLEENDVYLEAFEGASKKRSKTVILAKNLPAGTSIKEIKPLFTKFGILGRFLLPPSGVTALIEFLEPSEAKNAFQNLAYSKFKDSPLYLEWAPDNTFRSDAKLTDNLDNEDETENTEEKDYTEQKTKEESSKSNIPVEIEETNDEDPEPETTIFLRNLNYGTIEETIRKHFTHLGPIHMVQIARKKDPENPQNKISLGYGFIQFKRKATTDKALKSMQFTKMDGNKVELKRSDRTLKSDVQNNHSQAKATKEQKQTGTKMLVRNIPFQAKESEVREIFTAFGQLRSVRLPLKMAPGESTHRGFGFVDFMNKTHAKNAFETLQMSTHLYGRRLVLEWATDDTSVDDIRKRTADTYAGGQSSAKMSRKSVFDSSNVESYADKDEDL